MGELTGRKTDLCSRIYPAWFAKNIAPLMTICNYDCTAVSQSPSLQLPGNHITPRQCTTVCVCGLWKCLNREWAACGAPQDEQASSVNVSVPNIDCIYKGPKTPRHLPSLWLWIIIKSKHWRRWQADGETHEKITHLKSCYFQFYKSLFVESDSES